MGKIIRPRYPVEFSIGVLLLIFGLSLFFSHEIFRVRGVPRDEWMYFGMFLVSSAIIIMLLVLWEEFLFPIHVKPVVKGLLFRNHRNKLKTQAIIYASIPVIFIFIYLNYQVNTIPFFVCAFVCVVAPVTGKLISGIKNYNDFLKLTTEQIEYKNNTKAGALKLADVRNITLIKDQGNVLHKIQVVMSNDEEIMIDLDEMELEAYYHTIDKFILTYYKNLLKPTLS